MYKRIVLLIMDSLGIGALPDSKEFGDTNVNTFGHILEQNPNLNIPNLVKLGIFNIDQFQPTRSIEAPIGSFGRMSEISNGKDTTTGHWEIAGLHINEPFNTYPHGFPPEVIDPFVARTGRTILCNMPASGTTVLEELGELHMKTGQPIIYTSADSVFQIAAHEDIIPLDELYRMCEIAREILLGEHQVARVIARPFVGTPGHFKRTSNRRDYSLEPFRDTMLDLLKADGKDVLAVGKIVDIYCGKGITEDVHTKDNMDGVDQTLAYLKKDFNGLLFTNLVDFDSQYGHRRDAKGYGEAIEAFDSRLPEILDALTPDDLFIITADHGNDPTYEGTDHTREFVPLLIYSPKLNGGVNLGTRSTFADIAATVCENFGIPKTEIGTSFLNTLK